MADNLNILNIYSHIIFHKNKAINLKAFFAHNFDIQTTNFELFDK